MKKIWKVLILGVMLCIFCVGCKDDEVITQDKKMEDRTTEKRTEIIKQKTTQRTSQKTTQSKEQTEETLKPKEEKRLRSQLMQDIRRNR